ncbi:MAG: hypothetical protein RIG66_04330 [Coleofasciculus sp. E2-BRE-01]
MLISSTDYFVDANLLLGHGKPATALNEYLSELTSIRESLDSWKPIQAVK